METHDPAARFIALYAAILGYARSGPPQPFAQAVSQAIERLAPLAASVLIDSMAAAPKPGAVMDAAEAPKP